MRTKSICDTYLLGELLPVRGDKTNETCCLKAHLGELVQKYPMLELLTDDAIFAQRPLLEMLQQHGRKYLFQLKENQGDAFDAVKYAFSESGKPNDVALRVYLESGI